MDQPRDHADTSFAEAFEASLNFKKPEQGDLLRGTIVSISGDDAYVAYGGPTEAVINAAEIPELQVGDSVEATVVQTGSVLRISRKMLVKKASMETIRNAFQSRIPVEGKITGRNKGGFDVTVSALRAFCPLSQIALGKIENPDSFVGQTFEFRIIEFSEDGRKFVVSRTALMKEEAAAKADEVRKNIVPGAVLEGRVKTLTPFGAFVDLGGIEGLLHVSEMSRRRVNDPKEIVNIGDLLHVKVIKVENDGKRISLSMKEFEQDPWMDVWDRFPVGAQFNGKVVRSTEFGLFVELEPGVDGLVHVSQLPLGVKLGDPAVAIGAPVSGWIREVDPERKRISLVMREIPMEDPWEFAQSKYPSGRILEGTVERVSGPGVFIELEPGLTGLVPASELDLPPGADAARTFKAGDKMRVKVLSVDSQRKRLSLTHETSNEADSAEYSKYMSADKTQAAVDAAAGKSAMALALEKALEKK
jgi:small subunit ribosomal protein S1